MADVNLFTPSLTGTICLAVTASAHAGVALGGDAFAGTDIICFNQGTTVTTFIAFGATAAAAVANAVIPADGSPAGGIPIPPGWNTAFTLGPGMFVSAIGSAAGPTNLFITPGRAPSN